MPHLYFLPPKKKNNPWPKALGLLAGFIVLYTVGAMVGFIQA